MNGLLEGIVQSSRERELSTESSVERRGSLAAVLRGRASLSLLAEFKRRSPSAPKLAEHADLAAQVRGYEDAGAGGVSVLTEPTHFGGALTDLRAAAAVTSLPLLRKDFLVRPEQVTESAANGASAVLLIVRCLPGHQLGELVDACRRQQLDMLVECHDEDEIERALPFSEAMIGINNRDLDSLHVDTQRFMQLAPCVPHGRIVVAESGYREPQALRELHGLADAVLVGAALMQGACAAAFAAGRQS